MHKRHILLVMLFLAACSSTSRKVPVLDRPVHYPESKTQGEVKDWRPKTYTVQKGDKLHSIALEFGLDYKELAGWNDIANADIIRVGQILRLSPKEESVTIPLKPSTAIEAKPVSATADSEMLKTKPKGVRLPYSDQSLAALSQKKVEAETKAEAKPDAKPLPHVEAKQEISSNDEIEWGWPANGKVVSGFSETSNLKGIDIAGKMGQPVMASAPGKVVYTGSGLRSYGKLIIIKHNKSYLSAYAHNNQLLVKEGQMVVKGEKIAEMGNSDADQVMLHFEIRYLGKPVDPMKYLK